MYRTKPIALSFLALCLCISLSFAQERPDIDYIKVNCGGSTLEDVGFLEDEEYFSESSTGELGTYFDPDAPLASIPWALPYQSHRYSIGGILQYRLPVPDGTFDVSLMFAEQHEAAAMTGGRLMDLYINSVPLEKAIDVWTSAGGKMNEPYFLKKTGIASVDGYITIGLVPVVENPMLNGIVIEGDNAASVLWNTVAPGGATGGTAPAPSSATAPGPIVTPVPIAQATSASKDPVLASMLGIPTAPTAPTATPATAPEPELAAVPVAPPVPAASARGPGAWASEVYTSGMPVARHEACAIMAEGKVYSIGGRGVKDTSVYDPMSGAWTIVRGPPVEINHMQCVYYAGRIWIGGAWYGPFPREKEHTDTWVYTIATDSWAIEPGLPEGRRRGGGAFVEYQGKLYLSHGAIGGHGTHARTTGLFDVYDPTTRTWTTLPDAPNPRDHTTGAIVPGGLFCIAGGRDGSAADFWNVNIAPVDCYNFATGAWATLADMPEPRGGTMAGTLCDGRLMVAGGEGKSPTARSGRAYDRVDILDVRTNTWDAPSYMTSSRHGSGLAITSCSCGKVFVPSGSAGLGGGPEVTTTDVWTIGPAPARCI